MTAVDTRNFRSFIPFALGLTAGIALLLGMSSCSSAHRFAGDPPAAISIPGLPPPSEAAKLSSYTDSDRLKTGSGYLTAINQRVMHSGNRAVYSPSWDLAGSPTPADLAYAAYAFNIEGYDLDPDLHLRWCSAPAASTIWVGISHWPSDSWQFIAGNVSGDYPLGSMAGYINEAGLFLAIVIVAGQDERTLDCLRLGPLIGVWEVETVDTMIPWEISLAIDSANKPHIACQTSDTNAHEYWASYAHFDGSAWNIQKLGDTGFDTFPPSIACLDLDSADQPHVMYNDMIEVDWVYKHFDGTEWLAIDMEGIHGASNFALDSDDRPHIAYTGGGLHHAWHNRTEWLTEEIGVDLVAIMPDVALSATDTLYIAYYNWDSDQVILASFIDSMWDFYTPPCITSGTSPDVACPSAGPAAFTFYSSSEQELWYVHYVKGTGWSHQVPDSDGDVGKHASLAFDSLNHPHISYYDQDNRDLKYAYFNGSDWDVQIIEGDGIISGDICSIAIDNYDRPCIAFRGCEPPDGHDDQLRYAWRID